MKLQVLHIIINNQIRIQNHHILFQLCRLEAGRDAFTLPFTLSALADYISADRSAMMRELKKMREQGVVTVEGRRVTLRESA